MKKFLSNFQQSLQSIDTYSQRVNLLIKSQESYSTKLGMASSLFIGGITLFSFISLTLQMFQNSNPNIVSKTIQDLNPPAYYFDPDEFLFVLGLADLKAYPIINTPNETYYTLSLDFCQQSIVQNGSSSMSHRTCYSIDMVNCLQTELNPSLISGLSEQRLGWAMCPNRTTWNLIKNETFIQGVTTSPEFRYMQTSVFRCDPTKRSGIHIFTERLCSFGKNGQMAITERLLDQGKPGNPYQYISNTNYYTFTNTSSTNLIYQLRHSYFDDEINYFYYFPQLDNYHVLVLEQTSVSYVNSPGMLMHIGFILSSKSEVFSRTYNNFFDILGNVGGIQGFLTFLFGLIMIPYTKKAQQIALLNTVFQFDKDGTSKDLISLEKLPSTTLMNQQSLPMKSSLTKKKTTDVQLKRYLTQKHKKLELSIWEKITMGCFGKNQDLIRKGQRKIEKQLEITVILNKLNELEKLKHFLLNDHQLKLFEYIPKPVITLTKKNQIIPQNTSTSLDYFGKDTQFDFKVEQALNSYRMLKTSNKDDDQKLINMLDREIKDVFDNIIPMNDMNPYEGSPHPNGYKITSLQSRSRIKDIFDDIDDLELNNQQNRFQKI